MYETPWTLRAIVLYRELRSLKHSIHKVPDDDYDDESRKKLNSKLLTISVWFRKYFPFEELSWNFYISKIEAKYLLTTLNEQMTNVFILRRLTRLKRIFKLLKTNVVFRNSTGYRDMIYTNKHHKWKSAVSKLFWLIHYMIHFNGISNHLRLFYI